MVIVPGKRGGTAVETSSSCSSRQRDEGNTVTIYPKASSTSAEQTQPAGVPPSPNLPRLEEQVLAYWKTDDTFNASVERNPAGSNGANEFVFYDRPPFANGVRCLSERP